MLEFSCLRLFETFKEVNSRMKLLNQSECIIVFFSLLMGSFVFGCVAFAADPTTEAECKGLTPNPGRCVEVPLIGSSACNSNESAIGSCEKTGVNDRVCCVPQGSTNDATCTRLDCNGVKGVCQTVSCGDGLKKNGICDTTLGVSQVCCIPDDCTPSESSTGSSSSTTSGSASLNYTPLENLPGFEGQSGDFATYFGNLYKLALWIVAISALFMLVVGGFLYLSSAGNTALLGTAKKVIYSALIGLVIALISWLLLDTINSDLTNLKLTGLTGAIGTSGANGTSTSTSATAGTGPGGSTTSGTYTHAEAVAALSAAGISVTSSTGCLGKDAAGCTTLEQIPKAAIDDLIAIKKDCGCSFSVTGGTETTGHKSHGPGKPIVDVTQDTTLGNFLYSKAGGSGSATITQSPGYGISKICVTTSWEKLNYKCGSYRETKPHFHLVF